MINLDVFDNNLQPGSDKQPAQWFIDANIPEPPADCDINELDNWLDEQERQQSK